MVGMGMIYDDTYRPFFHRVQQRDFRPPVGDIDVPLVSVATRTGRRAESYRRAAGASLHPFASHAARMPWTTC